MPAKVMPFCFFSSLGYFFSEEKKEHFSLCERGPLVWRGTEYSCLFFSMLLVSSVYFYFLSVSYVAALIFFDLIVCLHVFFTKAKKSEMLFELVI